MRQRPTNVSATGAIAARAASGPAAASPPGAAEDAWPAEHLADLLPDLRTRLDIDDAIDDATLMASLVEITRWGSRSDRWRAAFNSTLGQWLALRGRDLNTTLSVLVQLLPPARS